MVYKKDFRIKRGCYGVDILFRLIYMLLFMPLQDRPRAKRSDRTVAIDILGIVIVGFCALLGIETGKDFYLNIALAWALLSFIGTIALAKFLEGRDFDD